MQLALQDKVPSVSHLVVINGVKDHRNTRFVSVVNSSTQRVTVSVSNDPVNPFWTIDQQQSRLVAVDTKTRLVHKISFVVSTKTSGLPNRLTNQPTNQPINQSTNHHATNRPTIMQPIDQPTRTFSLILSHSLPVCFSPTLLYSFSPCNLFVY
ncbi:hypothetical protein T01_2756 [Trichinella spiralis]|uniref:Uncharacterized protein n=1 Tax=Trichinella spiralis TaxID=6334 RepID=A0A0V1B6F8_TRISP|nr:hypothetical protein T01_2756 [Trichinella spiralis]